MDLEILKSIQLLRSAFADGFFSAVTFMGTDTFVFLLVCALFWCIDRRAGEMVVFSLFVSFCANNILKDIIKRPRPIGVEGVHTDARELEGVKISAGGYPYSWSFPSGHAQGSASFFTAAAVWIKRRWATFVAAIAVLLVMLSRVYLGVHYPSDVVAGAVLGVGLTVLSIYIFNKFYSKRFFIYFSLAAMLLPVLLFCTDDTAKALGGLGGFAVGMLLEERYVGFKTDGRLLMRIIRLALGVALLMLIRLGLKELFVLIHPGSAVLEYIRYFAILFTASFAWPWVFTRLKV